MMQQGLYFGAIWTNTGNIGQMGWPDQQHLAVGC